jgi:crossover junction endodeoxyribonuclease RusA
LVVLSLPYPPSVNTYWRANGNRRFISKAGVEFKKAVSEYVINHNVPKLGDALLMVTVIVMPRSKRRFDLDNLLKGLLDSLQDAGVYDDDCQVEHLTIMRGKPVKGGACIVSIEPHQPKGELAPC